MGIFNLFGKKKTNYLVLDYKKRVPYKDEAYFERYILVKQKSIDLFISDIVGNQVHPDRIKFAHGNVSTYGLWKLIAIYSSGKPIDEVKEQYLQLIDYFVKGWEEEAYEPLLWMVSLGILLEVEERQFDKLVNLLDQEHYQDYLLDYLIAYRKPSRRISEQVNFESYYKGAIETTKLSTPESEQRLKKYLDQEWYQSSKDCYWYNNHMSPNNTYFGYWSFESGAVAKIMALDDSSFKDNEHYPYDLVHWKQTQA
jgi:hypothetical protein